MKRRKFLTAMGAGAAAATIASPAIAQSMPTLKWRLTASWPKSLDTLFGACTLISKYVSEATDGKFQIQTFAAGEIVPGLQVLELGAERHRRAGPHRDVLLHRQGPDLGAVLLGSVRAERASAERLVLSWRRPEADRRVRRSKYNVKCLLSGNTGTQMGGWFRKEIKTVADLKGLKMRIGGWAGKTMAKLGVVPQLIAGGDIYPALEKGTIDAAEWVGPYDDEKLGFYKVAKYYYYPGWWEGGTTNHLLVNQGKWHDLPKNYQAVLEGAAAYANVSTLAKYDAVNPNALKRLVAKGAQLRPFSQQIMEACLKASNQVNAEESAKNANYKKVLAAMQAFRDNENLWWQVAEYTFENFMIRTRGHNNG